MGLRFSSAVPAGLASLFPNISPAAFSLLADILRIDPARRPSAAQALRHEWFSADGDSPAARSVPSPERTRGSGASSSRALDEILGSLLAADEKENTGNRASVLARDIQAKPTSIADDRASLIVEDLLNDL
jgi:serine/threonine protein kinase